MAKFADRVKVSTSTTGQGTTISLGSAESGFQVVPTSLNGHTLRYVIEDGSAWEVGTAVYDSSGPSLTSRTLTSSSTGALLSLTGSAKVFISASADDLDLLYADITVTVSGGNYLIDGTANQTITLVPSVTYRFDVSDSTNSSHPLRFSTTSDGTHNSGTQFTTGITTIGTAGSAGAIIEVKLEQDAPDLYYYCANHSGMGGSVSMGGTTYSNATTSADGLMSSADKTKLDGVATSANNYTLPTASASTLGGIKIGTGLSIDGSGVVTASGGSSSSSGGSLVPITTTKTVVNSAGQTVFTGSWRAANIAVFLNGVKLQDSEVTATDTQITISATAVGDVVEVVEYGAPFASPYASTFPTVTTGATSVTVNYTPDKVAVYKNGVKLRGGGVDFTASNGTSITGFSAFVSGDVVEVVEHGSLAESGGGVTTYANKTAIDAVSSPSEGDLAYDLAADQLYIRTTSAWKRVSAGTDESPIVTTEPASTHTLNSDGSTSTVTMVAEDPEGFDVTYGIAYPTASNALPNQLATATSINQSTGVFTFDPSTNTSHAGDVKVRLSASDGVSTTTRFCTLSLEFFGGVYGVHGDGTVIQADSNVTRSVYGSPSAVTDSAFAQQVLRLDSATTNKGVTFESLPSYSLNSDTGSKRIVYAVKIDTNSGASLGITHRDKDGNVLNFVTAQSNLVMANSGSAGRYWSTNYWDQWIIVCPYAYNSNFTASSGDVTLRVKTVGSGTPSDVTLGGSLGYAAPTISNNNSMYFYSGAVTGVSGYTSRSDMEHSMGGLAVYPVSYGTVDQTIADFENALVG